jgi:Fur family iron response transcriptional regulator
MDMLKANERQADFPGTPVKDACRQCGLCHGGCATRDVGITLRDAGLRLTRQRLELARLLFQAGDRHFTADALHEDATRRGIMISLATVYNTLSNPAVVNCWSVL